jgi:Hsp20/alpha crystallin family
MSNRRKHLQRSAPVGRFPKASLTFLTRNAAFDDFRTLPAGLFEPFFGRFELVDASATKARYRNGVLEIEIPKREEAKPQQIQINVGSRRING